MLYYLFEYIHQNFSMPGSGVFQYISFRSAMALITSLIISLLFGKRIIRLLMKMQIGESVRDLGLEGQKEKQGTPTMGGLIILAAILIPTFLFARLMNVYVIIMIITTVWLGLIGFIDDYIKVFKKDKAGLAGRFKILGQVGLGIIIGFTIYFNPHVLVKEKIAKENIVVQKSTGTIIDDIRQSENELFSKTSVKSTKTTIPFVKNHEFDYALLIKWIGKDYKKWAWIIFVPVVILIITAVSNGANITDGIDGLATGTSAIIGSTLGILAYVSGNTVFADYLNIMYIPNTGELVVFISAFVGACVGFLWYNAYPAQVFMGDTGSLALGGIIATFAICIRKELLIPILCGIFLVENLSVMIQVSYFKYTKKKYGEGRRIFKMSPLHHHYQKLGYHESKIVTRFWVVGIVLAVLTVVTLKLR
ncbi:MAG: phospho-N-acetylmuramoyl-pentapeptide-transferase [Bacteroidetes bacterium]|nr:MAG: phospho-N-acetylmuramoyl-pentapeptide-transferase [Bacteroidota bacterium]REK03488.1 MAG: phospho-N-acetylmuramoyl-pentapeptide-transferase [Bacteroidota bacterium]REK34793.1 MAG: phospho-N-acetylmuramoyl-pentapeptide-transferase [Bacteroidota bacterium]REK51328.1 MAG: phospho-N-acetylmuramoyl-pentapeptide-transferase [Bacteroidota bacterium]